MSTTHVNHYGSGCRRTARPCAQLPPAHVSTSMISSAMPTSRHNRGRSLLPRPTAAEGCPAVREDRDVDVSHTFLHTWDVGGADRGDSQVAPSQTKAGQREPNVTLSSRVRARRGSCVIRPRRGSSGSARPSSSGQRTRRTMPSAISIPVTSPSGKGATAGVEVARGLDRDRRGLGAAFDRLDPVKLGAEQGDLVSVGGRLRPRAVQLRLHLGEGPMIGLRRAARAEDGLVRMARDQDWLCRVRAGPRKQRLVVAGAQLPVCGRGGRAESEAALERPPEVSDDELREPGEAWPRRSPGGRGRGREGRGSRRGW